MCNFPRHRSRQSGQAIAYVVVMLGVLVLALGYVYNAGQLINQKTKLQNSADAVAYSVATIESKDLNFKAYTNRIMVANQVAIAQTVGLVSWTRWLKITVRNIEAVTWWVPYVGQVITAVERIVEQVSDGIISALINVVAPALEGWMSVVEQSQIAMHATTLVAAENVVRTVAKANDPDIDTSFSLRSVAWAQDYVRQHMRTTKRFDPDKVRNNGRRTKAYRQNKPRLDEFRDITMASRDEFSTDRGYELFPLWTGIHRFELKKRGGTTLVSDIDDAQYGSWIAMDTISVHRKKLSWRGWGKWKEMLPVGWGASRNDREGENIRFSDFDSKHHVGGSWRRNEFASELAEWEFQDADSVEGSGSLEFQGLRQFYDLTLDGLVKRGPSINILLSKNKDKVKTTGEVRQGTSSSELKMAGQTLGSLEIEQDAKSPNDKLNAIARATTYFARMNDASPQARGDQLREYGNLYNPYWQPKLDRLNKGTKKMLQATVAAGL